MVALLALGLAALPARPAAARLLPAMPVAQARLGSASAIGGDVTEGGPSGALGLLWPAARGVLVGVELSADDFGSSVGRLRDPHDGEDLGAVADIHRAALGLAWRIDGRMPTWHGVQPFATGTWGLWRIRDDHLGHSTDSSTAAGLSAGGGVRRSFGGVSVGASAAWHRVFSPMVSRWLSAGLDLGWR